MDAEDVSKVLTFIAMLSFWKKCKLLGSRLDTETDIHQRKGMAVDSMKKMDKVEHSDRYPLACGRDYFKSYFSGECFFAIITQWRETYIYVFPTAWWRHDIYTRPFDVNF